MSTATLTLLILVGSILCIVLGALIGIGSIPLFSDYTKRKKKTASDRRPLN
jgi:hypothetical protein